MKRLYRSRNRVLGGVCAGLGNYMDVDPVLIRLIAALIIFFSCFSGLLAYFIAWAIIPEEPFA